METYNEYTVVGLAAPLPLPYSPDSGARSPCVGRGVLSAGWLKVKADRKVSSALDDMNFILSDNPWVHFVNVHVKSIQSEQIIAYVWALSLLWVNPDRQLNPTQMLLHFPSWTLSETGKRKGKAKARKLVGQDKLFS